MDKEMNNRQAACLLVLFLTGNSSLFGVGSPAGRDSWIALLLACAAALLVTLIYTRIHRLNASHDFFEALTALFGKWTGRIMAILMIWYALHLGALLMRTLTEFGMATSIVNPPIISCSFSLLLPEFTSFAAALPRSADGPLSFSSL